MPRRTDTVLGVPDLCDLDKICEVLNSSDRPKQSHELRQLITRWRESDSDLERMFSLDPALEQELQSSWFGKYMIGNNGRAHIVLRPKKLQHTPHEYAVGLFAVLTLNPESHRLGGPCAYGPCGEYFIQKRNGRAAYCSRRCCQSASAVGHTQKRYQEERGNKLRKAKIALHAWRTSRTNDDWKTSVCKQEPELTSRFLTQAVTRGDLKPPDSKHRRGKSPNVSAA
jgi:hypothetical protein